MLGYRNLEKNLKTQPLTSKYRLNTAWWRGKGPVWSFWVNTVRSTNSAFGSQCPRLEEGLVIVHTSSVHVGPRLHVIQRIGHAIERLKEAVVVNVLRLGANPQLHGLVLGLGVHSLDSSHNSHRLVLVDVAFNSI